MGCVCRVEGKNPAVSSQFLEAGAEWYKTAARLRSMKTETEVGESTAFYKRLQVMVLQVYKLWSYKCISHGPTSV